MNNTKLSFNISNLLGSSSKRISQVAHARQTLIYICGCYLIFYSPILDQQIAYIKHRNENISAIAVSPNQKYIAVAQSGKHPNIFVYDVEITLTMEGQINQKPIWILKGHKISIDLLSFSPNSKYLVSICNGDGSMFIWQNGQAITKNKLPKSINKLMFDHNQDLLTIGRAYFKVWKFSHGNVIRKKQGDCWMIQGRTINSLGKKFSTKQFVDASVYQNKEQNQISLVLLSSDGQLCILQQSYEKISKWIELMMQNTTSIQIIGNMALYGGDNALIKITNLATLCSEGKFPKPPPKNKQNIEKDQFLQYKQNEVFPKCTGILIFSNFVLTLYENLTMFIWKMEEEIIAIRSIITHREKINCVCLLQEIKGDISFFGTASQDNTLRIWHFYKKCFDNNKESLDIAEVIGIKRNVYCKNLTRIIYTDSEHPIIRMKMYMKEFIVCISKQEFLMYSLQNFQLVLHENFQEQFKASRIKSQIILSLQVYQELIYLGFQNGFLRIYKPSYDNLLKMKEFDIGTAVQQIKMYDKKKLLIKGKTKVLSYNIQTHQKIVQQNIESCGVSQNYLILCEKKKIIYFNIQKNKKTGQISLGHQLDEDQEIKTVKSNSWFIALISSKYRLIVANFSQTIMYSEMMNQEIVDIDVTENGEIILVGHQGDIIIKAINDPKYSKMQQKVKKWFQQNDMSWMDNSVWTHSKNQTHSSIKNRSVQRSTNKQYSFNSIENAKSIKMGNILGDQSIRLYELPNIQVQYKNQNNKMSVFNPSNILKQLNEVNNVVNGVMKNRQENRSVQKDVNFSSSLQKIELVSADSSSTLQKQKKKIFQQKKEEFMPKFCNNLVESYVNTNRNNELVASRYNADNANSNESFIMQQSKPKSQNMIQSKLVANKVTKNQNIKSKVPPYYNEQSPSFSYSKSRESQTLRYSSQNYTDKQEQVRNSLQLFNKNDDKSISPISMKKNRCSMDQIVSTFKEILTTVQEGQEYMDKPYIKSLVSQNQAQFFKLYSILGQYFQEKSQKKNTINQREQQQILKQERQKVLIQYQKMSNEFMQFLKK